MATILTTTIARDSDPDPDMIPGDNCCTVCWEITDAFLVTNCKHLFCLMCIDSWIRAQASKNKPETCPYCRTELD